MQDQENDLDDKNKEPSKEESRDTSEKKDDKIDATEQTLETKQVDEVEKSTPPDATNQDSLPEEKEEPSTNEDDSEKVSVSQNNDIRGDKNISIGNVNGALKIENIGENKKSDPSSEFEINAKDRKSVV